MDALERIERAIGEQGETLARIDERTLGFQRELAAAHHRIGEVKADCDADAARLDDRMDALSARAGSSRRAALTVGGGGAVGTLGLVQLLDWLRDPANLSWIKRFLGVA